MSDKKDEPAMKSLPPVGAYLCDDTEAFARYWKKGAWNEPNRETALTCMEQAVNGWKNLAYSLARSAHYYNLQNRGLDSPSEAEGRTCPYCGVVREKAGRCPAHDVYNCPYVWPWPGAAHDAAPGRSEGKE